LLSSPDDARQPSRHAVTDPKDVVIGSVRQHQIDRQIGPLLEVSCEHARHERNVGLDLVACILVATIAVMIGERREPPPPSSDVSDQG